MRVKTEYVEMCNQKANERRASVYSKSVQKQKAKKVILGVLTSIFFVGAIGVVGNQELESVIAATETVEAKEYYVICDVDETEIGANDETILAVIMQDGSIQNYEITDAPEGYISEVCFKTMDLDDYTTYEVVAVR